MPRRHINSPNAAIFFVANLFFAGCATGPQIPSIPELISRNTAQDGSACLHTSEVRRYSVGDDEFIFIDGSLAFYIVTANPGCQDLSTSPGLAFEGRMNKMCGGSMDKIRTRGHECTIREIFKFDNRDAAFAAYENAATQRRVIESEAKK